MATSTDLAAAVAELAAEVAALQPDTGDTSAWTVYRLPPSLWALVDVYPEPVNGADYRVLERLASTKGGALVKLADMTAGIRLARSFIGVAD